MITRNSIYDSETRCVSGSVVESIDPPVFTVSGIVGLSARVGSYGGDGAGVRAVSWLQYRPQELLGPFVASLAFGTICLCL